MEMNFISNIILYITFRTFCSEISYITTKSYIMHFEKVCVIMQTKTPVKYPNEFKVCNKNIIYIVRNKLFKIIKTKLLTNEIESTKLIDSTFY